MIENTVLSPQKDKQLKCRNSGDIWLETMYQLELHGILPFPFHIVFSKCYTRQQIHDIKINHKMLMADDHVNLQDISGN